MEVKGRILVGNGDFVLVVVLGLEVLAYNLKIGIFFLGRVWISGSEPWPTPISIALKIGVSEMGSVSALLVLLLEGLNIVWRMSIWKWSKTLI